MQEQKIVVITGASCGIGQEMSSRFKADGHTVVCLMRTNPNLEPHFIACDLTDDAQIERAASQIIKDYGTVDILINNAGVGISGATELLPPEKVRFVLELDYFAAVNLTRRLLPVMHKGSKIVNISSACALFALPFRGVYCSAKAAISMFSYSLRMELSRSGIAVVCVCPGDILTPFTENRLKYNSTNERYGNRVSAAAHKVDSRNHKRMSAQFAGKKLYKIVTKKSKALYIIGSKYKFLYFCSRVLPINLFLKLTNALFGGK